MSTMITEVYRAFKSANVPDDLAENAAKALADYDTRFNKVDHELAFIKAELTVLKWICATTMASTIGILAMLTKEFLFKSPLLC